jgi:hypothetical protein
MSIETNKEGQLAFLRLTLLALFSFSMLRGLTQIPVSSVPQGPAFLAVFMSSDLLDSVVNCPTSMIISGIMGLQGEIREAVYESD